MNAVNDRTELERLAQRAAGIREHRIYASRPFVLEFAGSPKSGKSTSVETLNHFLKRNKFHTHVLRERASFCPIPMKGHLFFNTWCACTMLSEMLENIDTETDVIIKDRGLFDSLIWLRMQVNKGEVTNSEATRMQDFLLMDRWTRLVDLVAVLTVSPSEAIEREHAPRISMGRGSIMNEAKLASINEAIDDARSRYQSHFRRIEVYDTTDQQARKTNIKIADDILNRLEEFFNPNILVVDRAFVESLPLGNGAHFVDDPDQTLLRQIAERQTFIPRSEAEDSDRFVQIIPCAVLTHSGRLFVFERAEKDQKSNLHGRLTVWQGAHVSQSEEQPDLDKLIKTTIDMKLNEKLFLGREFKAKYVGYCWDRGNPDSDKHLGVVYKLDIDSEDVANDLQAKEFRSGRGHGLSGKFVESLCLSGRLCELPLEPWSKAFLGAELKGRG